MFEGLHKIEGLFPGRVHDLWSPLTEKDEHYIWTPLQTAVAEGKYDRVVELLERRPCQGRVQQQQLEKHRFASFRPKNGGTGEKRYDIFKLILNHTANVNAHNNKSHTPLHVAIISKNDPAFQDLIAAGAYIHRTAIDIQASDLRHRRSEYERRKVLNGKKVKMSAADMTKLQGPAFIGLREFMLEQAGISHEVWQKKNRGVSYEFKSSFQFDTPPTSIGTIGQLELSKAADRFHESKAEATEPHILGPMGDEYLGLCNLHEFRILKKMMLEAYPAQKTFNALQLALLIFDGTGRLSISFKSRPICLKILTSASSAYERKSI